MERAGGEERYGEKTARRILEPRPYYSDPYTTVFDTRVVVRRQDERGLWVALERSYFYPESGGQEPDRGTLSGVRAHSCRPPQIEDPRNCRVRLAALWR